MLPTHGDSDAAETRSVAPARPRGAAEWRDLVSSAALALAAFVLHLELALRLDRLGAFERFNTLFGADPNLRLEALRRGDPLFRLAHPGLSYLLGIPIRALGRLAATLVPGNPVPDQAARAIALGVAPLASALSCVVLLRLFRRLGLPFTAALLLTLLTALSFSSIIYGSMPETYGVSALAIAIAYALFVRSHRVGVPTELAWLAAGVFASGVTITNIVPVAVLYFVRAARKQGRPGVALVRTIGMGALAVFIASAAGVASEAFLRVRGAPGPSEREWIARYVVEQPLLHYATFPTAIVNGIAPAPPTRLPAFSLEMRAQAGTSRRKAAPSEDVAAPGGAPGDTAPRGAAAGGAEGGVAAGRPNARLARLTLQPSHRPFSPRNLGGIVLLAVLAWAAFHRRDGDPETVSVARASLAIIGFNWILHGFWGGETFLYSQHWHVSLMFAVAALTLIAGARRRAVVAILAASTAAVAASNMLVLSRLLSLIAGR
jgi:hypothetical protein